MTVAELREKLKGLPGNARVLAPAFDHNYREVTAERTTALYHEVGRCWSEDFLDDMTPEDEAEFGKRNTVLVIR
jgi:hypothetical protein